MNYSEIPDWEHLRKRYLAFWNNQTEGNSIIAHIQNPNPASQAFPPEQWMAEASDAKYLNPEKLYKHKEWQRGFWNWHADLFKYAMPSYGPNVFIGFCGAKVVFGADTVWVEPTISSVDEFESVKFDQENFYWKALLESIDYAVKNLKGEIHIGLPDFGGPADWISSVMGAENFLLACVESPDEVAAFALRLAEECCLAFDYAYKIISKANDGSVNWMPVWADGCMGTVQDDMAVNFSPAMYADIFLPAIRRMSEYTGKTVLHWHDGCSQHINWIVKEDSLDLVQFGHDPNAGAFRNQVGNMRKIQAAGKKLFISCVEAEDVEFFINSLNPRGLMMIINTKDDDSSRKMIADVHKWTGARMQNID